MSRPNERTKQRARERATVGAAFLAALKLAAGCMDCGYNDHPEVLEFDHRPGTLKIRDMSTMRSSSFAGILVEAEKCDIVCANCHRLRTMWRHKENPRSVRAGIP